MQLAGITAPSFPSTDIHSSISLLLSSFCHSLGKKDEDAKLLASSLLHDTVFPGQKRKATAGKETPVLEGLDLGDLESLFLAQPLLETTLQRLLLHLFSLPPRSPLAPILPSLDPPTSTSLSTLQQIFLASNLPHHLRALWRPVFSTDLHGESFSKFAGNIINQGPTLIVVWDEVCASLSFLVTRFKTTIFRPAMCLAVLQLTVGVLDPNSMESLRASCSSWLPPWGSSTPPPSTPTTSTST